MSDSNQAKLNSIGWNELITKNQAGSVEFYTKLLGWTTESMPMPNGGSYTLFKSAGEMVAGCMALPKDAALAPTMWMGYVNVADLDSATEKAKTLGATILKERMDLPMGSFVILQDPQGATISLWQNAQSSACE